MYQAVNLNRPSPIYAKPKRRDVPNDLFFAGSLSHRVYNYDIWVSENQNIFVYRWGEGFLKKEIGFQSASEPASSFWSMANDMAKRLKKDLQDPSISPNAPNA